LAVKGNRNKTRDRKEDLNFSHRSLCFDLAEAKGTQFVEVPLGSKFLSYGSVGQADVITIKPSYNRFNLDIFEVKVQRSDFLQDIKSKKYENIMEDKCSLCKNISSEMIVVTNVKVLYFCPECAEKLRTKLYEAIVFGESRKSV